MLVFVDSAAEGCIDKSGALPRRPRFRAGRRLGPLIASLLLVLTPGLAAGQAAPNCPPGAAPQFEFGFAELATALGDTIGAPLECEHAMPSTGDTLQQTTTGLAFYRQRTNIPTFTDGFNHWGLTADGLVYWTGDAIDPPGVRSEDVIADTRANVTPEQPMSTPSTVVTPSLTSSPSASATPTATVTASPAPRVTATSTPVATQAAPVTSVPSDRELVANLTVWVRPFQFSQGATLLLSGSLCNRAVGWSATDIDVWYSTRSRSGVLVVPGGYHSYRILGPVRAGTCRTVDTPLGLPFFTRDTEGWLDHVEWAWVRE